MYDSLNLLVKPTHMCNLNCKYCYDKPMRDKYGKYIMPLETVVAIRDRLPKYAEIQWIWHGGEPSTVSSEWYEKAMGLLIERTDIAWTFSVQSNGLCLPDDLLDVWEKYGVSIGLSYDGETQADREHNTTDSNTLRTIKHLKERNISFGTITVVTKRNYLDVGTTYIEMCDLINGGPGYNRIFGSERADEFDLYLGPEEIRYVTENLLDAVKLNNLPVERMSMEHIKALCGIDTHVCRYSDCRFRWINIDPDGKLHMCDKTPSDRFVGPSIYDYTDITQYFKSDVYKLHSFCIDRRVRLVCSKCPIGHLCRGGCPLEHYNGYDFKGVALDKTTCEEEHAELLGAWNFLKNLDIFDPNLNMNYRALFFNELTFSPLEIKQFYTDLGETFEDNTFWLDSKLYKYFNGITTYIRKSVLFDQAIPRKKPERQRLLLSIIEEKKYSECDTIHTNLESTQYTVCATN